jgi:hypothetical protein
MINYKDIEELGFEKQHGNDSVYEKEYGRPYWFMTYDAKVMYMGGTNEITFNWDCDTRNVSMFINEKFSRLFEDLEDLQELFSLFKP